MEIHLRKRKKWNRNLDIPLLVMMTEGYSGADLEALVEEAIENCFIQRRDALTEEDFRQAQNYIHPASEVFPARVGQAKESIQKKCFKDAGSDEGKIAVRLWDAGERLEKMMARYKHPFSATIGEEAHRKGLPNEMNYVMDYRLIYCLRNGLPLDMDVYDAAEWSCITELSEKSVLNGSMPMSIPDFTRGAWKTT